MNIFRDLVEELKDENLLEETVIDPVSEGEESVDQVSAEDNPPAPESSEDDSISSEADAAAVVELSESESGDAQEEVVSDTQVDIVDEAEESDQSSDVVLDAEGIVEPVTLEESQEESVETAPAENASQAPVTPKAPAPAKREVRRTPEEERQFYRQRAMDEVTGLQLVEHVLSGVEREQMKTTPKSFDDLAVKRALHDFLKVADNLNSPEHAQAEFQLMQETENWASALSRRDRNISVAHLRRFCETTKPALSSQAMISLARFYRNSPYSESVRSKFDLVFTKLFSKEIGEEKREVVFKNEELVNHIQELYADWSSIPLYSTDEDDSDLLLAALKFQEFINEANTAESFDELVGKDFFKRLKVFKEKNNENFFAPILIAAAIESNVAVGNRYVELIEQERDSSASNSIGEKYGIAYDDSVSDATSKTLELLEMIQDEKARSAPKAPKNIDEILDKPLKPIAKPKKERKPEPEETVKESKAKFTLSGSVNKWLIVATVVVAILFTWQFTQSDGVGNPEESRANGKAKAFVLSGNVIGKHVHSARISKNTLFGITKDSWDQLSAKEKTEFVKKSLEVGNKKNEFRKVHLLNEGGESMAFGSKNRIKVY